MSALSKVQEKKVRFHIKGGQKKMDGTKFTRADLLPSNRWNSVRYEFLKKCDHFLYEEDILWECHQGCGHTVREHIVYFVSFGDGPAEICIDTVRVNDIYSLGYSAVASHLFDAHADFVGKKLKKMGVAK